MIKHLLAAAALASLAPTAAFAASGAGSIAVNLGGLDLANPADRRIADRRVEAAIRTLCETPGPRPLAARSVEDACKADARAAVRF